MCTGYKSRTQVLTQEPKLQKLPFLRYLRRRVQCLSGVAVQRTPCQHPGRCPPTEVHCTVHCTLYRILCTVQCTVYSVLYSGYVQYYPCKGSNLEVGRPPTPCSGSETSYMFARVDTKGGHQDSCGGGRAPPTPNISFNK